MVRIGQTLRKRNAQTRLDLSSLAKGFAVDRLGEILESFGVNDYLLEIGGELRARGYRATEEPWTVGIEQPDGAISQGIMLFNSHIASSGSYRNFRQESGKRLSHIIDGRTGEPIDHSLVAVSVVHKSTMLADAWATALLVVGEQRALQLIDKLGLAAQLTVWNGDGFSVTRSPSFTSLLLETS